MLKIHDGNLLFCHDISIHVKGKELYSSLLFDKTKGGEDLLLAYSRGRKLLACASKEKILLA
ncbi:unnamed protein product [Musa textilis]